MRGIIERVSSWAYGFTGGIVAREYASATVDDEDADTKKLHWLGRSCDKIAFACRDFYGHKNAYRYLPPDLMDLARRYIGPRYSAIDSQGVLPFNRFEVIEAGDDEAIYEELPTGYEVFDVEETLVLIAQIVTMWVKKSPSFQLAAVSECGFFMADEDEVPWTIRILRNDGQPIVTWDVFNETDVVWTEHSVILSPEPVGENYPHSLES